MFVPFKHHATRIMHYRILYKLLILIFLSINIIAQPYLDLGQAAYQNSPGKDPESFSHFRAQVNFPIVLKDSSIILINPVWEERWFQIAPQTDQQHFRGSITWLTYSRDISAKWSAMAAFIPRWNGEPEVQFSKGFQAGGALLMTYHKNAGLSYKFGLYYNREFWGNFFIPLLGIDWTINKKQKLFGILPGYLIYENRLSKTISWGGNFRTFTSSYRLKSNTSSSVNFTRIDDNQLGAYADFYLTRKIVLSTETGYSIMRKIRTGYNHTSKDQYNVLSNNSAPYFRVTFQYRLRLDK